MSAGIKRMLSEQAAAEAKKAPASAEMAPADEALLARIAIAAPYIDKGCDPLRWNPSQLLTIGFFVIATGPRGHAAAHRYVEKMLERARRQWVAGEHPNPFRVASA